MTTEIATSPIFYTVYQRQHSPSSPYFRVIGAYSDIRDAIQAIATHYRRRGGSYGIESSENRPRHWVHASKYRD
jgi:hypothetical protein